MFIFFYPLEIKKKTCTKIVQNFNSSSAHFLEQKFKKQEYTFDQHLGDGTRSSFLRLERFVVYGWWESGAKYRNSSRKISWEIQNLIKVK